MREAIDYNALSWVRKELGETLRQARLQLEEYAVGEQRKALLQTAAARLHEARGPLQMVNIKGADLLACEMEEAIADLLLGSASEPDAVLELLMQGFLEMPEYLSGLRSGAQDSPAVLMPLVNSLRAVRGLEPVHAAALYAPNLSARVPRSVFDPHARPGDHDMKALARSARLRFQSGLLEWYRGGHGSHGPQTLVDVLEHLMQHARGEPAARVWWVGAGLAELVRDGMLEESAALKRLFGQLDRSIKRLMDRGEAVFSDLLTDDLMKNMLFQVAAAGGGSERIAAIRATYGIEPVAAHGNDEQPAGRLSDEVLQSFSGSARADIERIMQQVESYQQHPDPAVLEALAGDMHAIANRLDMVGMQALGQVVGERERELRALAAGTRRDDADVLAELAGTLVVAEDALAELGGTNTAAATGTDADAGYQQGRRAVIEAVIADLAGAKESIGEFLKSSGSFRLLDDVPAILHRIHGGLELLGEERLAAASSRISEFVAGELLERQRTLDADELDSLADAICSVEFCVEQLSENQFYGDHAIQVAENRLAGLGYPVGATVTDVAGEDVAVAVDAAPVAEAVASVAEPEDVSADVTVDGTAAEPAAQVTADETGETALISSRQTLAEDADPEIVEIFLEEAAEMLGHLDEQVPAWCANPADAGLLGEMRRAFHTLKGSGRMIGAFAAGEFAWAFENLLNRIIDNTVTAGDTVLALMNASPAAMRELVAVVGAPDSTVTVDVDALAQAAMRASRGEVVTLPGEAGAAVDAVPEQADDTHMHVEVAESVEDAAHAEVFAPELQDQSEAEPPVAYDLPEPADDTFMLAMDAEPVEDAAHAEAFAPELQDQSEAVPPVAYDLPEPADDTLMLAMDAEPAGHAAHAEEFAPEPRDHADAEQTAVPDMQEQADDMFMQAPDAEPAGHAVHADECLPALKEHADAEIVEIFLEEAAQEHALIESGLRRWLAQPDDGLLEELRRAFHTMKGSGRMAGAMLTGEFCWSIETLIARLQETGDAPGPMTGELLGAVPDALAALLAQVQGGGKPWQDIAGMMRQAGALADGSLADECVAAALPVDEEVPDTGVANDPVLMELFSRESGEHLAALAACVAEQDGDHHVSERLYRSLHTLTGISESAQVPGIGRIAGALYGYFAGLYHDDRAAAPAAFAVLDDCVREMQAQHARLPELVCDDAVGTALVERIALLPEPDEETAGADMSGSVSAHHADAAGDGWLDAVADDAGQDDSADAALPEPVVDGAQNGSVADDAYAALDPELFEVFVEEATEIMDAGDGTLRNWSAQPDDRQLMAEYQRHLHTLKGGARMLDIAPIGDLSHRVESLLAGAGEGEVPVTDKLFALLNEAQDRLADMLELVKARRTVAAAGELEARLDDFLHGVAAAPSGDAASAADVEPRAVHEAGHAQQDTVTGEPEPAVTTDVMVDQSQEQVARVLPVARMPARVERRQAGRPRSEQVRVQSDVLDNMVNNAGEISIYRTRLEQQVSNYRFNLGELDQTITRLHEQLRQLEIETEAQILYRFEQDADNRLEFDPLELDRYSTLQQLSRSLIESISDLRSLQDIMEHTTRDAETLLLQQSRVSTDLQESLIRTRMIPFSGMAPRLRRIVRQSARELDKRVELQLQGADGEMDRAVIERIIAPLEHMLRNSIAHGIEAPAQRLAAGKDATGTIRIAFDREGPEIVLRITDDGAGLNIDAIRARAVERGLLAADATLPDADIMQFILQSGFSTADEVTQLAGRGVGMDVVSSEVKQLGGSLDLASVPGAGATFTVRLPYTLAINQALLVNVGEETFCVPIGSIEGVVRLFPEELRACYQSEARTFDYAGNRYHLKHLATLLGSGRLDTTQFAGQVPVLLARVGDKRVGLQVESLLGSREIVIKPLGLQLSMVDGISGATILGDGRVVMILDVASVARMQSQSLPPQPAPVSRQEAPDGRLAVMVVDDSITVRKVTTRLLERNGYRVMTAKDGVDAMGQLADTVPDMMLLDIEMPRMDGFELATHIRNDETLRHLPIIMITSRTGDKHRERAQAIGVNEYLGKPYQESELLDAIHAILGMQSASSGH